MGQVLQVLIHMGGSQANISQANGESSYFAARV